MIQRIGDVSRSLTALGAAVEAAFTLALQSEYPVAAQQE
jgi:hypothetical protein